MKQLTWQSQAPRVLLFHPDTETLERWREGLGNCVVETSTDATQLEGASKRPDVVIGRWQEKLMERLRARWPAIRFIHFGDGLSPSVLDAIAQGHEVFHVEHTDDLEDKVFEVVRPRRSDSRRKMHGLQISWDGGPRRFEVVDISTRGLSFIAQPGDDLARLQPGTTLDQIQITSDDRPALSEVSASIRRVDVHDSGYLIGCELQPMFHAPHAPPRVVKDRALCAGLLHSAARSGVISLIEPDTGHLLQSFGGAVDLDRTELTIDLIGHPFKLFDVIDGTFELAGGAYRFRAAVCGEHPLKLRVPAFLEETRQRATRRWHPRRAQLTATMSSPLLASPIHRTVYDLSVAGLSFEATARDVLPLGMHFDRIEITLGTVTLQLRGRILNLALSGNTPRYGVKLEDLDEFERNYLADFIVRARYPGVENGREISFAELWQFFRDSGFVYPEKEAVLAPLMPKVREVYGALNARPHSISRSVAIRKDDQLVGYCAGLQAYHGTWMFHHLAALPGNASGAVLSMGVVEQLMQSVEYNYFRMWFFADASFPRRLFGGFARKVAEANESSLRYFAHFHVPVDRRFGGESTNLEVSEATDDELFVVERYFIGHEQPITIHSEDLTARGLRLDAVHQMYRQEGLERRRHVIAARLQGVMVGFALAEASSPGLNLSEALSSFQLFLLPSNEAIREDVHRALLDAALALYGSLGRVVGRCLINPSDAGYFESLGIKLDEGRSICWTARRIQLPPFAEHIRNVFARLAARGQRSTQPTTADAS